MEQMKEKIIRLCQLIANSTPDTTVKGEIESLALEIEMKLKMPESTNIRTPEYIVKTLVYPAWVSAANAYRLYPNRKHTFVDYWNDNKDYLMSLYKELL